ncbi:DNA-processing protein DprA [Phytohabitans sp. ZYX-F-186]|uniref:DNA-processing protein DprA n=1 Tax=Phytohabitans maris TaxID=3071409 RepID=A0ABU0ZJM8_9ACTN|nr:DNA-processing protein DprA [Phytohabitans sp. ZYX-F-186]MDQ7907257.1 DNA-processing protein DprA [Phytohabitans sp. ZYX-F-186]
MREVSVNEGLRLARIALHWLVEPGNEAVHRMVNANGPLRALERLVEGDVPDPQLRGAAAARMGAGDPHKVAEMALERAERLGARIVIPEDDEWPRTVRDLTKLLGRPADDRIDRDVAPPLCLWVRGTPRLDESLAQSVAVVGARASTHYGEHVATTLAYELAEREWTIVSGGAYGIDAAAHRGALNAGGLTVAVLACGVDRPYPSGNTGLFDRIADAGLLVSEWPPGTVPVRHRFLIRNRVIAAATRGTVVVEASARSGASQTLRRAIALGRRPMVVPGPVTSAMSVGCHELLRDHLEVRLVTGAAHVLEEVGHIGSDLAPRPRGPQRPHDSLDAESAMVLESVPRRGSAGPDELAAKAGIDIRTAMRKLTLLESLGFVVRRASGYVLAPKPRSSRASASPPDAGPGPSTASTNRRKAAASALPPNADSAPTTTSTSRRRAAAGAPPPDSLKAVPASAPPLDGDHRAAAVSGTRRAAGSRALKERETGAAS